MAFRKVERSYHSTQNGCRLATFEEARDGLETIKKQHLLNTWDRARLLDGWITGPGYNFQMGNDFKGCLGYMLLIQAEASGGAYDDVHLSDRGKEVALFLCVDDWNYEVVYWLLNCWSNSETMKVGDVRGGNIPFSNVAKDEFVKMNKMIGSVSRKLGEEGGAALEKAGKTKYSGKDSIKEVLSGVIQVVTEEMDIIQFLGRARWYFTWYEGDEYCLPDSVMTGDVAEPFWSFVCDSFAGYVVEVCALTSLLDIRRMKTKSTSQKNFMTATTILLYLSDFRSDIIHEPLAHHCKNSCAEKILRYAAEKAVGAPQSFYAMLQCNAMWRCYGDTGNYDVLSKLLFIVAKGKYTHIGRGENITGTVVDMLMECGAQPGKCYAIGKYEKKTALHFAAKFDEEDVGIEVAKALLRRCDGQSIDEFVNAADERGRTALHRASEEGNARICGLLVDHGALVKAQDENGMTALHYALEGGFDEVIDVLVRSPQVTESLDLKNRGGYTPLDIAIDFMDRESTAKLLSKSKEPEAYFNRVNEEQLLRNSLLLGSVDIVDKLFKKGIRLPSPAGDRDEDGKTAVHLAAMCDDEDSAIEIIFYKIDGNKENMVAKQDRTGRTALHEAALKGHEKLCQRLLNINPKLIYMKDRDGQNPLYDAVKGDYASTTLYKRLLAAYLMNDKPEDELIDRNGLTPLHVAATQGKAQLVKELLSSDKIKTKYLSKGDIHAQTALHKAVKRGDKSTVEILLKNGAHPLRERDCDGKTALHYAVQAETEHKEDLANMFFRRCESDEEKSLLFWASAAGLGTAEDLSKDDPLHKFLVAKKETLKKGNLLQMAACLGDIEMTKELISRGYQIGDIRDSNWKTGLSKAKKENVDRVSRQIEMIKEQGNDKPAISDSLGRLDYAQGLAALFLNPYIKPPIAVGITGSWGMGKSSLMLQTERILLTAAAHMALLKYTKSSSSKLPDIKPCELSRKGKRKLNNIYRQIKCRELVNRNIFVIFWDYIRSKLKPTSVNKIQEELEKFLNEYDLKYLKVFKALAAMDSRDMLKTNAWRPKADPSAEENVPAVLTVQYNAWKYRNDTEALAGIAVEITRELEGIMTQAQWLNTCWRNTWKKKKYTLWIEIFFPSLLALVLVGSFTWIGWVAFDSGKLKEWGKAKYAWPPAALVIIVWTLTKSIMGILNPVSTQLMQYISFPDHTDKLGYQERVISDISFLKDEIGKKAYWVFIVFAWVLTTFKVVWGLITELWLTSLLFHRRSHEEAIETPKVTPAAGSNLRIIVFVDDLDRCQGSVILQVLSAVNLVLAVCEISVVMGMDKRLIKRAIIKKYKDVKANESLKDKQELADMYLQKIVQLPLDLPDPSDEESRRFLKAQLGVLENDDPSDEESMKLLKGQLGVLENENTAFSKDDRSSSSDDEEREGVQQNTAAQVEISVHSASEITETAKDQDRSVVGPTISREISLPAKARGEAPSQINGNATITSIQQNLTTSILIREMLFVRYSQGEERAFLYFQGLATDCRKLPREWKRLLNYHRSVWYIFSVSKEAKNLAGWQVQLITWIFVCWEWQDNMNLVIEKWKESGKKFLTSESKDPSLLMIVEHLIKEHEREIPKVTATSKGEDETKKTQKSGEMGVSAAEKTNTEETESGSAEQEKLNENGEGSIQKTTNGEVHIGTSTNDIENKLDKLEKSLAELKREMKELKELVSHELKKDIKDFKKQLSDELKEDIRDLKKQLSDELKEDIKEIKEQIVKKESGKNEEKRNKKNRELHENWERMKSILEKYDVSMDGIQAFQRFRFYCIAGYLPRP